MSAVLLTMIIHTLEIKMHKTKISVCFILKSVLSTLVVRLFCHSEACLDIHAANTEYFQREAPSWQRSSPALCESQIIFIVE